MIVWDILLVPALSIHYNIVGVIIVRAISATMLWVLTTSVSELKAITKVKKNYSCCQLPDIILINFLSALYLKLGLLYF